MGLPRQMPRHWQAFLRQDLYHVVTGSILGFSSASLLVVSQLECPVSFFGAASTSAPPYKVDPGHFRHCPFWLPFTTRSSVRGWVFYPPHPRGPWWANYGVWGLRIEFWLRDADFEDFNQDFHEIVVQTNPKTIYFSASECLRGEACLLIPHSKPHFRP